MILEPECFDFKKFVDDGPELKFLSFDSDYRIACEYNHVLTVDYITKNKNKSMYIVGSL